MEENSLVSNFGGTNCGCYLEAKGWGVGAVVLGLSGFILFGHQSLRLHAWHILGHAISSILSLITLTLPVEPLPKVAKRRLVSTPHLVSSFKHW